MISFFQFILFIVLCLCPGEKKEQTFAYRGKTYKIIASEKDVTVTVDGRTKIYSFHDFYYNFCNSTMRDHVEACARIYPDEASAHIKIGLKEEQNQRSNQSIQHQEVNVRNHSFIINQFRTTDTEFLQQQQLGDLKSQYDFALLLNKIRKRVLNI